MINFFRRRSKIKGHFEGVAEGCARGWVFRPDQPNQPLTIEITDGDKAVTVGLANQFRQDMLDHGFGDGHHAFCIPISAALWDSPTLGAREVSTGTILTAAIQNCTSSNAESERNESIPERADRLLTLGQKEDAIFLLQESLCKHPLDATIAAKLLTLLGQEKVPAHLPGSAHITRCDNARILLDIAIAEYEKRLQSRGAL